ncbi:MAG: hypothetical protein ACLQVF_35135 [Isosphaeraceae bacterium]
MTLVDLLEAFGLPALSCPLGLERRRLWSLVARQLRRRRFSGGHDFYGGIVERSLVEAPSHGSSEQIERKQNGLHEYDTIGRNWPGDTLYTANLHRKCGRTRIRDRSLFTPRFIKTVLRHVL